MSEQKIISVLIAEDIHPIRDRYIHILEQDPQIRVIAAVSNEDSAVEQTLKKKPDVILMDIEMGTRDAGLIASKRILEQLPDAKIIILTVYEEDDLVFYAFQLGVCDYMLKNSTMEEIIDGVKAAYYGISPIRPEIAKKIRTEFRRVKSYESSFLYLLNIFASLTSTELDILDLHSQGYSRSEICRIRQVEMSTVKTQVHNILQKFNKKRVSEVLQLLNETNLLNLVITARKNNKSLF